MKNLLQSLEKLGQQGSIYQYSSAEEMVNDLRIEASVIEKSYIQSRDLICSMDPGDDDED